MADTTTELEVLDEIVDVLGGQSGQYETVVPVLQQIKGLLGGITDPEAIAEAVAAWLDEHPELMPQFVQQDSSFFIGKDAGKNNQESEYGSGDDGRWNTAIGVSAMEKNTTGDHCAAIGYRALYNNTTGDSNTALGEDALHSNTSGGGNTAVGVHALQNATTASSNTAVGESALISDTTGYFNTAVGDLSGFDGTPVTTDDRCTFVGAKTGKSVSSPLSNATAIGYGAKATKSKQVVIGSASIEEVVIAGKVISFNQDGTVTWTSATA